MSIWANLSAGERTRIGALLDEHLTYLMHGWVELAGHEHRADILASTTDLPVWVVLRVGKDSTRAPMTSAETTRLDNFLKTLTK